MARLYKNKYRTQSIRHPVWDYSRDWLYFVTICVKDFRCVLGKVTNEKVKLSDIGKMVEEFWRQIPNHFEIVLLDEFVIMPNHLHGIIIIDSERRSIDDPAGFDISVGSDVRRDAIHGVSDDDRDRLDAINRVSTTTTRMVGGITGKNNPMLNTSLAKIIRWYKGRTAFEIHKIDKNFHWQSSFYDRIIRNDRELNKIRFYIRTNPAKWDFDKNNRGGIWT